MLQDTDAEVFILNLYSQFYFYNYTLDSFL